MTQVEHNFRPDIQGLRAVAVLAVVAYHFDLPGFGGGFVGVDVFFVISGFLITGLLWRERTSTGTIQLHRFYASRARRLLPAAVTVIVATAAAARLLLPPTETRVVLGDAIASALYVGNYRLAERGSDYLAAGAANSPFMHYWSLGAEEQFYLLWPVLMIATALFSRRIAPRRGVTDYLIALGLIATTSFVTSLIWTQTLPTWAYYSLASRAWELSAGGLVALSIPLWRRLSGPAASTLGWTGLVLIAYAGTRFDNATAFPGTAALIPVVGATLAIGAGCAGSDLGAGRILSLPWLQAIGRGSYSWYLWHWPVSVLAPHLLGHAPGLLERLVLAAVSGGLAAATLRLIENPVRFATALTRSPARSLALGGTLTSLGICVPLILVLASPPTVGAGADAEGLVITQPPRTGAATPTDRYDEAVRDAFAQVRAAVAESADRNAVPANLTPSLTGAGSDKPSVFVNGCVRSWRETGQPECVSGDTAATTTVTLVGDSHAAMWQPAFELIAPQHNWKIVTMSKITCPLLDLPITSPYLARRYSECEQWRDQVFTRLHQQRPQLIVLSMSRRYGADFGFTAYDQSWLDSLTRTVTKLRATGARVLVLGPVPDPHGIVPDCLSAHLTDATTCAPSQSAAYPDGGIAAEAHAADAGTARYADLSPLFCTTTRCPVIVGNNLVFRDDNHLTTRHTQTLAPAIAALTERALAEP
ncbi:acyltransferase [Nocardia colli]|uniref:Acyltransferase n=1 Tax=Nocardia colli TaxID=2545717 RepID=A0A5N0EQ74_9NOCA|nr:acyltransferase family protein [Nocardia colli]KAA8889651.1 acyltransferase [Nocardia colli]